MFLSFIVSLQHLESNTPIGIQILFNILCVVILFLFIFLFYIRIRYDNLASFLQETIDLCSEYDKRRISELTVDTCKEDFQFGVNLFFDKLPSINKMIFSFKPLKLESYLSSELIKKLKS